MILPQPLETGILSETLECLQCSPLRIWVQLNTENQWKNGDVNILNFVSSSLQRTEPAEINKISLFSSKCQPSLWATLYPATAVQYRMLNVFGVEFTK